MFSDVRIQVVFLSLLQLATHRIDGSFRRTRIMCVRFLGYTEVGALYLLIDLHTNGLKIEYDTVSLFQKKTPVTPKATVKQEKAAKRDTPKDQDAGKYIMY